jgi:hypothetical protein
MENGFKKSRALRESGLQHFLDTQQGEAVQQKAIKHLGLQKAPFIQLSNSYRINQTHAASGVHLNQHVGVG